jgi:hypothetical protein
MALSADNLVRALTVCSGGPADHPDEIVALVRRAQPSFAATLYSAWQAAGTPLNPALGYELDTARARIELYRSVAASLLPAVSGLTTVKGLEVGALYPDGWVRDMSDVDFIAPSEAALWEGVGLLTGDGWELNTATFSFVGGALQIMVSLNRPHEDRYEPRYGIELATYVTLGNQAGIPPVLRLPDEWRSPAIKNTLMLLHERYEQPFRARDLVDAALLHDALHDAELAVLHRAVVTLGLAAEYSELVRLAGQAGLGPLSELPGGRLTLARVRAQRLARGASFFAQPLAGTGRHLQRRLLTRQPGRAEQRAWAAVQRRLSVPAAVTAGLLAFGLPLDGPRPGVTRTVLYRRGDLAWADTPAGRLLLTIGDEVDEDAVDELSGSADSPRGAVDMTAEMSR